MKRIRKGPEPESLVRWKAARGDNPGPSYERLRNPVKGLLHSALLREQGYLCCYCDCRITENNHHIEHLLPKAHFPDLEVEYSNLMASCQGGIEDAPPRQIHCGHKKGEWFDEELMVSPLSPACESYFRYTSLGEMLPSNDESKRAAAGATIEHLGLDIEKLTAARKRALAPVLEVLDGLTEEEGRNLICKYDEPGPAGSFAPFSEAIVYVLRQYFPD